MVKYPIIFAAVIVIGILIMKFYFDRKKL